MLLTVMQKDLLKELVNIYIGQAASLLSEMVNQKILLKIPDIELVSMDTNDVNFYRNQETSELSHIISSSIKFGNSFSGKAYLIFPADQAKAIVNACIGEEISEEGNKTTQTLHDTDFDVLREISNVILNAIVGEFGNFIQVKLDYSLPELELIYIPDTKKNIISYNDMYILVLHTNFNLTDTKVNGTIIIALGMESITMLINKLNGELAE
jgi:chemotaxis protein CheC